MPTFEFTSPDGKKYEVNGPEGATREQAFGILQQQIGGAPAEKPFSLEDESAKQRAGIAHGFMNPIAGGAELLAKITPAPVENAINSANNWLADKTGLVSRVPEGGVHELNKQNEAAYQKQRGADADNVDWSSMVGEALNPVNYVGGGLIKAAGPLATGIGATYRNIGRAATSGAVAGALNPTESDDFWKEKAQQGVGGAVVGGAFGLGFEGLSGTARKVGEYLGGKYPDALENAAVRKILKRISQSEKYGGPSATQMLDAMNASRKPLTMVDQSDGLLGLAGNVYRRQGEGRQITKNFLTPRDKEATARMVNDINNYVTSGPTARQATEGLLKSRSAAARKSYDPAFNLQNVWSPRLQEFLENPTVKEGLSKGWQLERDIALAEGRPITATQLGVDLDMEGNVKLLSVPNMRLLDMAKQGLDSIISSERNEVTGRLSHRGVVIDKMRRAFLEEMDSLDTKGLYRKARQEYSGHSGSLDATRLGRTTFERGFEENTELASKMTPSDLEFARLGMADIMKERLLKAGFSGDEAKALINSEWMKAQIRPFFRSIDEYDQFVNAVAEEHSMFNTNRTIMGGSQTAERRAEDTEGGGAEKGGKLLFDLATKGLMTTAKNAFQMYRDLGLKDNPDLNSKIAEILFRTRVPKGTPLHDKLTGKASIDPQNALQGLTQGLSSAGQGIAPPAAASMSQTQGQNLPGFQDGGEFVVGGEGGPDSQVVQFKASPGEKVTVEPNDALTPNLPQDAITPNLPAGDALSANLPRKPPELRAYNPTWRDRLAKFVLGDQPSYHAQRMAREVIGSSGLGTEDYNVLDFTPVGSALHVQEELQHGNPAEAGGYAAGAVAPMVGTAARTMAPLARTGLAALTGAAVGAGTTFAASEAEAGGGLSQEQQYAINRTRDPAQRDQLRAKFMEENSYNKEQEGVITGLDPKEQPFYRGLTKEGREKFLQQKQTQRDYNIQQDAIIATLPEEQKATYKSLSPEDRVKFMNKRASDLSDKNKASEIAQTLPEADRPLFMSLDAEGRKKYMDARLTKAQETAKAKAERDEELKPFKERYKNLMNYVPAVAAGLSAAVPYAAKARQAWQAGSYIKGWEEVAAKAEEALQNRDLMAAMPYISALEKYEAEHQDVLSGFLMTGKNAAGETVLGGAPKGAGIVGTGLAATIPFDMEFLTPNAIDAALLPSDSKSQQDAVHNLTDWHEYGQRLPTALLQGVIPAAISNWKLPIGGRTTPPTAKSSGQIAAFRRATDEVKEIAKRLPEEHQAVFLGLPDEPARQKFLQDFAKQGHLDSIGADLSKTDRAAFRSLNTDAERAQFMQEHAERVRTRNSRAAKPGAAAPNKTKVDKPGTPPKPRTRKPNKTAEVQELLDSMGIPA